MDDVTISNNQVEGEVGAISNSGALSLKNVRIYGNTASNYSAIYNSKIGRANIETDVQIFDNHAIQDIYSEGVLGVDFI